MPSFDIVSEVDRQEVRNAVDQAQREINTRFDFKNTNSSIEHADLVLTLRTVSEDRLAALRVVVEEKLVKRGVSLKGVEYGKVEEATQNTVRQVMTIHVGISGDKARQINKMIKEKAREGRQQPDPGRVGARDGQEARRPPGRDLDAEGRRPGDPPAVRELQGLIDGLRRRQSSGGASVARRWSSSTTPASARVVVSPRLRPSATSRSRRRMILPLRVLGRSGVK